MNQQDLIKIACLIEKNDWDENPVLQHENYSISQFEGTAFGSDYRCYKITWFERAHVGYDILPNKVQQCMVAKVTHQREELALRLLAGKGFSVPKIYAVLRSKTKSIMLFEQMILGTELYANSTHSAWKDTAAELAAIHMEFWDTSASFKEIECEFPANDIILGKIRRAYERTSHKALWRCYVEEIIKRLDKAPKTLIHGDMFPTNIMVGKSKVYFVDWADACVYAYMFDVARLTAIIDVKTLRPMCPCSQEVLLAYYEKINTRLQVSYSDYIKDVQMAQFVELASIYSPSSYWVEKEYTRVLETELDKIAMAYFR